MLSNDSGYSGVSPVTDVLTRISEALRFSLTDISDPTFQRMHDTCEILKHLAKIEDGQDRMKVLAFIRTIADRYPD